MIDNFEKIKDLIYFNELDNIYISVHVKDKFWFVTSRNNLDDIKNEVIAACNKHNTVAFVTVSGRYFRELQNQLLYELAKYNVENITCNPYKVLSSINIKSISNKWIINLDDPLLESHIIEWLGNYFKLYIFYTSIDTPKGKHLIVRPFDLNQFHKSFPHIKVEIEADETVLYAPEIKYVCNECGGSNIQIEAYIDPNTNEYISDIDTNECWCENCKKQTRIKEL